MKKIIAYSIFILSLLGTKLIGQATIFDLNATRTALTTTTISVKVQVKYDASDDMGFANYVFTYDTSLVSQPSINTIHNFSGGSYSTMTLTNPTATSSSINIVYNNGTATAVSTSYVDVITIDFTIKNQSGTFNLAWDNGAANTVNFNASFGQQAIGTLTN